MWTCPKCGTKVDPSFEVCWSCGTTPDGMEDPNFVTADAAGPIDDPAAAPKDPRAPDEDLPRARAVFEEFEQRKRGRALPVEE